MTFKAILVHADPGPGSNRRIRLALRVADMFDAAVTGLGAEAFGTTLASGYAMAAEGALIEASMKRVATDLPAAEKHFRALAAGHCGLGWIAAEDYPDKMLALYARGADLIVASRPSRGEGAAYAATPADLVMEAGVPVLMAPDDDAPFCAERIIVAWKDTRESRRAVTDALPFLKLAQQVVVVAVCGEAEVHSHKAGVADVQRRLAKHGVSAVVEVIPKGRDSIAEALEDAANRHSADLIVTGAYGHSRLREWTLGGVTEDFLAASSKFLLLSH
jgi:nucleotide-binding universal stress UspA family protein